MFALLIRHALVTAHDRIGLRAEVSLSPEGEVQARRLAESLGSRELAAIFSSPLRRTLQTANLIAADRGIGVTTDPALIEVNPGDWEGRRFDELASDPVWKLFNTFRSGTRIPGGEMMIEVQARVVSFLEKTSRQYRGRTIAVVSHADVIRAAICHYAGIPLDLSLRVEISPASVSTLQIEEWGARLIGLNQTQDR